MTERTSKGDLLDAIDAVEESTNRTRNEIEELRSLVRGLPDLDRKEPLDDQFSIGQEVTATVEDDGSGTKHGDPLARVNGVVVFLKGAELSPGDTADAVVTDVADGHLRAVVKQDQQ